MGKNGPRDGRHPERGREGRYGREVGCEGGKERGRGRGREGQREGGKDRGREGPFKFTLNTVHDTPPSSQEGNA